MNGDNLRPDLGSNFRTFRSTENFISMEKIDAARKIDTAGRIMIPAPIRKKYGIQVGDIYDFYIHETDNGETYLAIKCPQVSDEILNAMEVLRNAGMLE